MYKTIQKWIMILSLLVAVLHTSSCKKMIEIPPSPPNQLSQAAQFADSVTAMSALAAVYTYSQQPNAFGFSDANLAICTGLSSDELFTTSSSQSTLQFYTYGLTPLNSYVGSLWSVPYRSLYTVNAVIENVSASKGLSASFKQQVTGEMKVMRALYYFNLVNLFGSVPLVTTTNYSISSMLPRTSVDSIYNFIIEELKAAKLALKTTYPSSGRLRPNQYVATALLAKVYLYRQQWQNAYNEATAVINSNVYKMVTDLNKVFLTGSTEAIWQVPATNAGSYSVTSEAATFVPYYSPTPTYVLSQLLWRNFEIGDKRLTNWAGLTVVANDSLYYPNKYKNVIPGSTTEDYMILRLAELYLIRAEASANLDNGSAAIADLNIVRTRSGLSSSTADPLSKTDVLKAIVQERKVELFTEWGARWFDLKRWGLAGTVLGAVKTGWVNEAALYPVPQNERQNNVNLTQNPGYN